VAKKRPIKVDDQLRQAIRYSGKTHYRLAKDAGISPDILDRFMSKNPKVKREIRSGTFAKIALILNLELRERG